MALTEKKDASNMFALVSFFEEQKFSVMRLKDCIPKIIEKETLDLVAWDQNQIIEVMWQEDFYPANILQFGGM